MKAKTVKVEPLKDNRIVLTIEQLPIRKPFARGQQCHGSAKDYNRRDFKEFDK